MLTRSGAHGTVESRINDVVPPTEPSFWRPLACSFAICSEVRFVSFGENWSRLSREKSVD
jgi:hypothetical protein